MSRKDRKKVASKKMSDNEKTGRDFGPMRDNFGIGTMSI